MSEFHPYWITHYYFLIGKNPWFNYSLLLRSVDLRRYFNMDSNKLKSRSVLVIW